MEPYAVFAESMRYPSPDRLPALKQAMPQVTGDARKGYAAFFKAIQELSCSEWEELYTRTWDLNPLAAPYVGYQAWGDNYPRGRFLASLNRALLEAAVDSDGELPDHLIPVLRYLAAVTEPLPELLEIFPAALERIISAVRRSDPANPYIHLLESILVYHKAKIRITS